MDRFTLGFLIEVLIVFAHGGDGERRFRVASAVAVVFALFSSIMFADGCHYIQVVWGSGLYFSEWGLGIATFSSFFAVVLCNHFFHLQRTVRRFYTEMRISTHDKKDKMAISLIRNHIFGSHALSKSRRTALKDDMGKSQTATPTTLSLFKLGSCCILSI